ncbi:MAG: heme lyase CcmF/NrfE family subunit [Acidimicrobiales bacterium]
MNAALGTSGVILGFLAASFGALTLVVGLVNRRPRLLQLGFTYAALILVGAVVSFAAMERALITRDFTLEYVAQVGSSLTPALYNFAALWGALEGSILLWALVLAGYIALVAFKFRARLTDPLVGWALVTLFVVAAFFFGLMIGPANPFTTWSPPPGFDGQGPNPLLQNHILMNVHPPMLYLGYVGFTVPFAFAIAALITGRVGEGWLLETRRWTLFAWGFLTAGIMLGAWWAYEVLGWGGYWGWDPVENASLLPWLTGTAYLHSVIVQERRGMLRVWNLSLLCATFSLTILGTFLTRSGVIESVHAFSISNVGPAFLGFFAVIVLVSVGLIGWRGDRLRSPGSIDSPLSREGSFLANNVLFGAFAFVVLLGTVFPLLVEVWNGDELQIGEPFFESMTIPIGLALLFLMAVAPALPWRKASTETLAARLQWPAWFGAACLVLAIVLGQRGLGTVLGFGLAGFAGGAAVRQLFLSVRRQGVRGLVGRSNGGMIVHIGVVLVAVGLIASGANVVSREFRMVPGDTVFVEGHELTLVSVQEEELDRKVRTWAEIQVDGGQVYEPAFSAFRMSGQLVPTPSVRTTWRNDIQLTMRPGDTPDDPIFVRALVQPLVVWLWVGGFVMAFGTVLAAVPTHRRRRTDRPVGRPAPSPDEATDGAEADRPRAEVGT